MPSLDELDADVNPLSEQTKVLSVLVLLCFSFALLKKPLDVRLQKKIVHLLVLAEMVEFEIIRKGF
jgi:hypothetical protein